MRALLASVAIVALVALASPLPAPARPAAKVKTCPNGVLHNSTGGQALVYGILRKRTTCKTIYKLASYAWVSAPDGFDNYQGWKCVAPSTSSPVTTYYCAKKGKKRAQFAIK